MHATRTVLALSVATLATACASRGYNGAASPPAGMAPMAMSAAGSRVAMEPRMRAMQDMQGGMGDGISMPADMAKRHQMMADRMPPSTARQ